jgi:hypothetical protein
MPPEEPKEHAMIRCHERRVPESVLESIQEGAYVARAREEDGRGSNFDIVRVVTWHS